MQRLRDKSDNPWAFFDLSSVAAGLQSAIIRMKNEEWWMKNDEWRMKNEELSASPIEKQGSAAELRF